MSNLKDFVDSLKHKAFNPAKSKGRRHQTDDDEEFNKIKPFLSDITKLLESKGLRRLKDKTQVYCFPENPHIRTRLSHTLEVTSLSLRIAAILGLNQELCHAIALGHDIGHTPYGHLGEDFISQATGKKFRHEKFGPILLHYIERKGQGLNLCFESYEGILNHSRTKDKVLSIDVKLPLEYGVVMMADKIAYTFSDVNDFLRYRRIHKKDLPPAVIKLGQKQRQRVQNCTFALIKESAQKEQISFSDSQEALLFSQTREWLYENMYQQERQPIYYDALSIAYEFLSKEALFRNINPALILALMTDKEVNSLVQIKLVSGQINLSHVKNFGFMEIVQYLEGKDIDYSNFTF